jgi:succinoglycan biosynthesis transport protein ExoP
MDREVEGWDVVSYLRLLWRHKWILVVTTLIGIGGTLGFDSQRTKMYQGTATILFISQNYAGPGEVSPLQASDVLTDIELVQSEAVYLHMVQMIHHTAPKPTVVELGTTDTAQVTVVSKNADFSASAANAYARAFVTVSETQYLVTQRNVESQLQRQISSLNSSISDLEHQISTTTAPSSLANLNTQLGNLEGNLDSLRTQLTQIQVEVAQSPSGGRVVTTATINHTPVSPKPLTDAILFGLLGLVLGVALALLREVLDDRIRDQAALELVTAPLPTLGLIPRVPQWRDKDASFLVATEEPSSPPAEAYRSLRTATQFLGLDKPVMTLQITSPVATEGKTTTAANLAATMAQNGRRVALVSCDLRRPRLHEFFGLSNDVGFTSIVVGAATLESALQKVPGFDSLHVLPSGPIPPNPSEILGLPQAHKIFATLRDQADIVIIDSPPVMPVTDASVLATVSDGILLVVAAKSTRRRDVRHALATLARVEATVVGVVLNGANEADSYGYYKYGYYKSDKDAPTLLAQNGTGQNGHDPEPTPILSRQQRRHSS